MATVTRTGPTRQQMMKSLERANNIRSTNRIVKALLAEDGLPVLGELFAQHRVDGLRVWELLEAIPMIGPEKTRQILTQLRIWPLKRVSQLTARQQRELIRAVMAQDHMRNWRKERRG